MKSPRAALVATAIPLLLTSLPLTAGERPHWSAAIGTGYAASATLTSPKVSSRGATNASATSSSDGVPASPHWTARIGTGTAAASSTTVHDAKQPSSSRAQPAVAAAHWTSRIGTGHASDSTSPVTQASFGNGR
jgi:hypothetical protein